MNRPLLVLCTAATVLGLAAPASASPAAPSVTAPTASVQYAVSRPVCAEPSSPTQVRCLAVRRVPVAKGTPGAVRVTRRAGVTYGPSGGYTPNDLASAYGYNPNVNRRTQTVAVVDWHDNPDALRDLDHFDRHYGLHAETASSFRKVNQSGRTSPLPATDRDAATEISLDLQAVRAVCHSCRIVLVEASHGSIASLAAAENTAARLGATEITNSYGMPEPRTLPASVVNAYNHPGVAITASTGDDGWYGWDFANGGAYASDGAASFPSTASSVVAVGGTTLRIGSGGTRSNEYVWNSNGADDSVGAARGPRGASGGGCSKLFAAPRWQSATPGYAAAGCRGKRLGTDVSALADPMYGFDVYDSYGIGGWATIGGTSLSSPVVAALYALAGGSGGTSYPASSLYTNRTYRAGALYDVTVGGNAFCAGDATSACQTAVSRIRGGYTNPNGIGAGPLDCSYPRSGRTSALPALSPECNATRGFDGASGVGAPKGVSALYPTTAALAISHAATIRHKHRSALGLRVTQRVAGTRVNSIVWHFGDGSTVSGKVYHLHHTWKRAGTYTVTVRVYDSRHQYATRHITVRVR